MTLITYISVVFATITALANSASNQGENCEDAAAISYLSPTLTNQFFYSKGIIMLRELNNDPTNVEIEIEVTGLKPGSIHAFHIHQFGDLSDPFDAQKTGNPWNISSVLVPHHVIQCEQETGNLGSWTADTLGNIWERFVVKGLLSLQPGDPRFVIGRSIVMHSGQKMSNQRWLQGVIGYKRNSCSLTARDDLKKLSTDVLQQYSATVNIIGINQNFFVSGKVNLYHLDEDNLIVDLNLFGLFPLSRYGVYIHEFGDIISRDGASAGEYFDPIPNESQGLCYAAGYLGHWNANIMGGIRVRKVVKNLSLDPISKYYIIGRSLVIHAERDDLPDNKSLSSEYRVGVGVIGLQMEPSKAL